MCNLLYDIAQHLVEVSDCGFVGEFAKNLPDYQKIEVMMFIMGKVPHPTENVPAKYVHITI